MHRIIIDPGVLIAALLSPTGSPRAVFNEWLTGAFELLVSPKLLTELENVLMREKFREWVTIEEAQQFVALIKSLTLPRRDPEAIEKVTRDPGDDYLVALARQEDASFIVSGDKDLLELRDIGPPVLTPADFLNRLD